MPTIERLNVGGRFIWLVQYGGMVRHFPDSEDWLAKQFFDFVCVSYGVTASSQASRSAM